jgi:hypothetical protein
MKKLLLISGFGLAAFSSMAQSFTIPKDTINYTVYGEAKLYNNITNVSSSAIQVKWKVVNHNFPTDWQNIQACDNNNCYADIVNGTEYTTADIDPSTNGNFYVLPNLNGTTSTGTYYLQIRMTHGTYSKDSWYFVNRFPTNVSNHQLRNEISIFPNPAVNNISIKYNGSKSPAKIKIQNIIGQTTYETKPTGSTTILDLAGFKPGLYFLRVYDVNDQLIAVNRFERL